MFNLNSGLLDSLPLELYGEILRHTAATARQVCSLFRNQQDACLTEVCLQWPKQAAPRLCLSAMDTADSNEIADELQGLLARMPQLLRLDLDLCPARCISVIAALPSLTGLTLVGSIYAPTLRLPSLSVCTALRRLNLSHPEIRPTYIHELAYCTALTDLDLSWCTSLVDITALSACQQLRRLKMTSCSQLTIMAPLSSCKHLLHLDIHLCYRLTGFASLPIGLRHLNARGCLGLLHLFPLASLPALTCLDLSHCLRHSNLLPLAACSSLTSLNLECIQASDITPLSACTSLTSLTMSNNARLSLLAPLEACVALESLFLRDCRSLAVITPVASLSRLRCLDLRGCPALRDIRCLLSCTALKSLLLQQEQIATCQMGVRNRDLALHGLKDQGTGS